jgi:hypothetical protein
VPTFADREVSYEQGGHSPRPINSVSQTEAATIPLKYLVTYDHEWTPFQIHYTLKLVQRWKSNTRPLPSSWMLHSVAIVRTDVSEDHIA